MNRRDVVEATQIINVSIVLGYLLLVSGVGAVFALRRKNADQFMLADRSLPGWAVGLSMFGSYISSISFLANPAITYKGDWMWSGFTLMTPVGLLIGTTVFLRYYRRSNTVSAYAHLEHRFGPWARSYVTFTYLLLQTTRMGTILYLLSQAVLPLLGQRPDQLWLARGIILAVGLLITFYTLFGGIEAVVWIGVLQSGVLLVGPVVCITTLLWKLPGGLGTVFATGAAYDKFGLGFEGTDLSVPTIYVIMTSAVLEHFRNWGMDQSYIQRYVSAKSERDAARSIWIAGLLYMPVACFFFFMGTALFAFYHAMPDRLPPGIPPDSVFPHFIGSELAPGLSGLVVAAIFAASMDSNLNSMATLTLVDGYKRYLRPRAADRESLIVLWAGTVFWGLASVAWALVLTLKGATTTLEFTAECGALLAGGTLGLFLLGLLSRRATSGIALVSVLAGVLVVTWMTLSRLNLSGITFWPDAWAPWRCPIHQMAGGIVTTAVILFVGFVLASLRRAHPLPAPAIGNPTIGSPATPLRGQGRRATVGNLT